MIHISSRLNRVGGPLYEVVDILSWQTCPESMERLVRFETEYLSFVPWSAELCDKTGSDSPWNISEGK